MKLLYGSYGESDGVRMMDRRIFRLEVKPLKWDIPHATERGHVRSIITPHPVAMLFKKSTQMS